MIVRMVHPEHGAMHVYDAGELERVRQYGWVPEEEAKAANALKEALAESMRMDPPPAEAPAAPVAEAPIKRKPGRPRKGE